MSDSTAREIAERLANQVAQNCIDWARRDFDFANATSLILAALADAEARVRQEQPRLVVSDIRQGEENEGPLQSTDLFLEGRGISLLCNVPSGERFTYSLIVDGQKVESGTVGVFAPALSARLAAVEQALREMREFTAAVFRVFAEQNEATFDAILVEARKAGVKDGFGARASAALGDPQ